MSLVTPSRLMIREENEHREENGKDKTQKNNLKKMTGAKSVKEAKIRNIQIGGRGANIAKN